jgi:3'-phosphoadenosine 5'-phosphosulfate sulfotransferase (PAPS reductase)/FAD synthetase
MNPIPNHTKIAFQLSGGRDSTAAFYLLQEYWPMMDVYHLDSGDRFPEVEAVIERCQNDFGRPFIRIDSSSEAIRQEHGEPTDLVPFNVEFIGRAMTGTQTKMQSRFDCCARTVMLPMHERMIADGITLVIRGVRQSDFAKQPYPNGVVENGIQIWHPIQEWSDLNVMEYLANQDLPITPMYSHGLSTTPECMTCTAWWDDGRAKYMREFHPIKFDEYRTRLLAVSEHIYPHIQTLTKELRA